MGRRRRRSSPSAPPPRPDFGALHPTLDLHGETADDARRRAARWLQEQRDAGVREVVLVTGWGRHSLGPPVLRGEIQDLLHSLRGTVVASSSLETGGGAFRVHLRRRAAERAAPAPRTVSAPPLLSDQRLRREAEEALADLGVTPTPTLVEAEVRRLLRERERKAP